MLFYIFNFFTASVFSFLYSKSKDYNIRIVFVVLTFLTLLLPVSLRYDIGSDYSTYALIYRRIQSGAPVVMDYGYYLLNKIIALANLDVQWLFAIMAFLTLLFVFIATPKGIFFIVIPFYYVNLYLFSYNGIRQGLVIAMGFYYFSRLIRGQKISFLLLALGFLFHKSALLYITIFILIKIIKINKTGAVILFTIIILLSPFTIFFTNIILTKLVPQGFIYLHYLTQTAGIETGISITGLIRYFVLFLLLIMTKQTKDSNIQYLLFIGYIMLDVFFSWTPVLKRISLGLLFSVIFIIHDCYVNSKIKKLVFVGIYLWCFWTLIVPLSRNDNEIVPYISIFSYDKKMSFYKDYVKLGM